MTLLCSGVSRRFTPRIVAALAAAAAAAAAPTPKAPGNPPVPVALAPAARLRDAVAGALRDLFADPAKILEVGIRKPPKEVEKSRAELRRFFAGSRLTRLAVPGAGPAAAIRGRFGPVDATLEGLTLMGLRLARADFELEGLRVDPRPLLAGGDLRILDLAAIGMRFKVEAGALNAVTDAFAISLPPGRFVVRGRRKLVVLPLGFEATGRLRFTPAGQILFRERDIRLGGLPLPGFFRRALRKRINPIFDLAKYLGVAAEVFTVRFEDILHRAGYLELTARAAVKLDGGGAGR